MPYAVLVEVVFTLGAYSVNDVSLLGRSGAGVATAAITLPRRQANGFPGSAPASIDFMVKMDDAGFVVSARGKAMAPGCRAPALASDGGGSPTVPKVNGSFDDARLAACASEIKGGVAGTPDRSATLFAQRGSDVQTVVGVLDALRGENGAGLSGGRARNRAQVIVLEAAAVKGAASSPSDGDRRSRPLIPGGESCESLAEWRSYSSSPSLSSAVPCRCRCWFGRGGFEDWPAHRRSRDASPPRCLP